MAKKMYTFELINNGRGIDNVDAGLYRNEKEAQAAGDSELDVYCPRGSENRRFYRAEVCSVIIPDSMIAELCKITTHTESGEHFTTAFEHWQEMERFGLIDIHRPKHRETGIPYSQDEWEVRVTPVGQDLVDENPELHPAQ